MLVVATVACGAISDEHAETVVRRYNDRVVTAYRVGDPRAVDGAAGPAETEKLEELIRLKRERGVVLDAALLELQTLTVDRSSGVRVTVETRELWRYVDRGLASGQPVGDPVTERYRVRYVLERLDGVWLVQRVDFVEPPEVIEGPSPSRRPS